MILQDLYSVPRTYRRLKIPTIYVVTFVEFGDHCPCFLQRYEAQCSATSVSYVAFCSAVSHVAHVVMRFSSVNFVTRFSSRATRSFSELMSRRILRSKFRIAVLLYASSRVGARHVRPVSMFCCSSRCAAWRGMDISASTGMLIACSGGVRVTDISPLRCR